MTIPSNISFSSSYTRLTVRCTCDNLDVISITLDKKRGNYRWRKESDGQVTTGPLATIDCVHQYLLDLVGIGRVSPIKAKSMVYALQDKGLRNRGGGAMGATVILNGHVDWVDLGSGHGVPVIRDEEPEPYDPYDR